MTLFFKKITLFLLISAFIAYGLQWIIDTGLKKSDYCPDYKEWYDIVNSKINSDIIIQGSSRAKLQISPSSIENNFKLTSYNLGMSGSYFPLQYYRFLVYLKYNKKPKYIIQSVDVGMFNNSKVTFNYEQYIPYLNGDFIRQFGSNSVFNQKDFYLPLYKYSHQAGLVEAGLTNFFNKSAKENGTYKGFISYNLHYDPKPLEYFIKQHTGEKNVFDTMAYNQFITFIEYCKAENIQLILVVTPSLKNFQNAVIGLNNNLKIFENLSKKYKITFLNYTEDKLCLDTAMFADFYHLNSKGVNIFNEQLIGDIAPLVHRH